MLLVYRYGELNLMFQDKYLRQDEVDEVKYKVFLLEDIRINSFCMHNCSKYLKYCNKLSRVENYLGTNKEKIFLESAAGQHKNFFKRTVTIVRGAG